MGRIKTVDDAKILGEATRLFRERGHAASTREIAKAVGISEAVLYQRFGSKQALFIAAMTPPPPETTALLGELPHRDAAKYLQELTARLVDYLADLMPTFLQVLTHPDVDHASLVSWHEALPFASLLTALAGRIQELRERGLVAQLEPQAAAHSLIAVAHSLALSEAFSGPLSRAGRATSVRAMVAVLWSGFAPPAATPTHPRRSAKSSQRSRRA